MFIASQGRSYNLAVSTVIVVHSCCNPEIVVSGIVYSVVVVVTIGAQRFYRRPGRNRVVSTVYFVTTITQCGGATLVTTNTILMVLRFWLYAVFSFAVQA